MPKKKKAQVILQSVRCSTPEQRTEIMSAVEGARLTYPQAVRRLPELLAIAKLLLEGQHDKAEARARKMVIG